jgi:hypothetical protein
MDDNLTISDCPVGRDVTNFIGGLKKIVLVPLVMPELPCAN